MPASCSPAARGRSAGSRSRCDVAAASFDSHAATAALLRLAGTSFSPSGDAAEQMRRARTAFLAWLVGLPAGTEREAARAARPGLSSLATNPILAEVLELID